MTHFGTDDESKDNVEPGECINCGETVEGVAHYSGAYLCYGCLDRVQIRRKE